MLRARKIRAFNATRAWLSDTCSLPHAEAHLAHYAPNFLFEQINQQNTTWKVSLQKRITWDAGFRMGHLCPLVFVSPDSKWCKRTASITLLWSFIASIFLCLANIAELSRGMLSCPLSAFECNQINGLYFSRQKLVHTLWYTWKFCLLSLPSPVPDMFNFCIKSQL